MAKCKFEIDGYYHIYNRGVDKRDIFCDEHDFIRFLRGMREFNRITPVGSLYLKSYLERKGNGEKGLSNPIGFDKPRQTVKGLTNPKGFVKPIKLVEILCYCLNPNHFHLLLKEQTGNGVSLFMKRLSIGYANYFNLKYKRSGSLFQGSFKAAEIRHYSRLLYLSGYINGNPEIHRISTVEVWPWSSCRDYLGLRQGTICDKTEIMAEFKGAAEYRGLMNEVIKDARQGKTELKELLDD